MFNRVFTGVGSRQACEGLCFVDALICERTFLDSKDEIEDFETKVAWVSLLSIPCIWPLSLACCGPCFLQQNVEWRTRAQHVALTEDGIKYVTDRHPTMCGLSCTDAGKVSKTVPYDKITDCDVHEPAGMACCCIQKTLTSLIVDTASSGPESHELVLTGLHDPHALKQAVWEMKRQGTGAPSMPQSGANETNQLLREIRDEMRLLNQHLQGQ